MDHGIKNGRNDVALEAVRNIRHIATLPEVTVRIIELVEDPDSSARDLHSMISSDLALTARMLKVVNSAFYGLPRQIASINRAVSLLGLNAVKNIAVAASLAKLFRDGELGPHFDARDLWLHSCVTASTARIIAKSNRKNAVDEAFLAGLVHDVGVLVELQHDRATFAEAVKRSAAGRDLRECERECLGNDHEGFGAALCEYWKFPSSLVWVAGHHHDPVSVPAANRDLPMIVHVADRIAAEVAGGFTLDLQSGGIAPEALECLGLDPLSLEAIRAQAAIVAREGGELLAAA
ncbi:MAG: HDOD domain-containing protein [Phycisphaerales bacterium]|nr:HDOD domain-containing protein [Phycisphaerales bacterium]